MCQPLHPPPYSCFVSATEIPVFYTTRLYSDIHCVTLARNFVCTISMQNQVKMVHDVSPTFSMDITLKLPYFPGKTIFLEPRGVSKHLRRVQRSDKSLAQAQICPFPKENTSLSEPKANSEERRQWGEGMIKVFAWHMLGNSLRLLWNYFSASIHIKFMVGKQRTTKRTIFGHPTYPWLPLLKALVRGEAPDQRFRGLKSRICWSIFCLI